MPSPATVTGPAEDASPILESTVPQYSGSGSASVLLMACR